MNSWFSANLGNETLVGKQKTEGDSLKLWFWDYERVFHCSVDLGIAASTGMEMSKEDFQHMLLELVTSPNSTKTVLSWTDSVLNFKSMMKICFASFSWTFVMERLPSKDAKVVVKDFISSLGWELPKPNFETSSNPKEALQIVEAPEEHKKETHQETIKTTEAVMPVSIAPHVLEQPPTNVPSSQNFSSDSALAILMELKDEAALTNALQTDSPKLDAVPSPIHAAPVAPVTPVKPEPNLISAPVSKISTSTSKEAQKRKELEELTAAKTKKPRRFI